VNCVKCVRTKAFLYDLAQSETKRHVSSLFLADEILSPTFQLKNNCLRQKLGNRLFFTDSVRITYFYRKLENGIVCRNLRIPSSLPKLWKLWTPTNTQNLVSKLIPTFAKLNRLSMNIICFHFHYFI